MTPPGNGVAQAPAKLDFLARIERWLLWVNAFFLYVGMIALVFFCFAQAVDRYTIHSSFDAHDQLAKVGLVWLVFTGMALGYSAGENLRIDLFSNRIPLRLIAARETIFEAAILVASVLIIWKAFAVVDVAGFQQILGTPFTNAVPYSAILLGITTIAFTSMVRLVHMVTGRTERAASF